MSIKTANGERIEKLDGIENTLARLREGQPKVVRNLVYHNEVIQRENGELVISGGELKVGETVRVVYSPDVNGSTMRVTRASRPLGRNVAEGIVIKVRPNRRRLGMGWADVEIVYDFVG